MRKGQSPTSLADFVAHLQGVSEVNWARLAAFLDGEGSILISRVRPSGRQANISHALIVNVGNTDPRLIVWLRDTFGGWAGPQKAQKDRAERITSRKPRFIWVVNCQQAAYILEQCLPYFIIKKGQAEIGIAFQTLRSRWRRGKKLPPEVIQQRDAHWAELKALHAEIPEAPESLMKRTPEKE
jgi:hypothetical protein